MSASEPTSEEVKIKDLSLKLQILSNAILEERNKSKKYLERIKEYEKTLQSKDNEISDLSKEKFDLKSKLTLEKSKHSSKTVPSTTGGLLAIFGAKPNTNLEQMEKLEETVNQLKFEKKELTTKLMEEKENYDQQKIKFQTLLTMTAQQLKEKDNELNEIKKANLDLHAQKDGINASMRDFDKEKQAFVAQYKVYEKDIADLKEELGKYKEQVNFFKQGNMDKETEIRNLKKQLSDLAIKLNDLKNQSTNEQLRPKTFKLERLKEGAFHHKRILDCTFQKNAKNNNYEMVFTNSDKKDQEVNEHINLLDISEFKINDKVKNKIDMAYIYQNKEVRLSITVHELLIDYFFQTYREFFKKANEFI